MNAAKRLRTSSWLPACAMLATLVVLVLSGFGLNPSARRAIAVSVSPASSTLVRWRDARHDWLLVGDGESDQLSIYNAADGSLVRRVAVKRGLNDANALAQRDGRLFVVGDDGRLGELKLPQLVAVNRP